MDRASFTATDRHDLDSNSPTNFLITHHQDQQSSIMSGIKFDLNTDGIDVVRHLQDQVSGRTFLITGPSEGGIGAETAISLAHGNPAMLILVGRTLSKIQPTIDAIHAVNPSITAKFIAADLTSLNSVREAAREILNDASITHIDVIINNAAVMACPYELTIDGFELQFATAHLGHFVLTNHILPKLRASAEAGKKPQKTRIINVSSKGSILGDGIRWDDPSYTKRPEEYKAWDSYGQAKTANVLFTLALNKRLLAKTGIRSYALHPGGIYTNLGRYVNEELMEEVKQRAWKGQEIPFKTLQQGCATTLRAALDPELEKEEDAVFLSDCQFTKDPELVAPWALDEGNAERLWGLSEELVGEKFEI